MKGHVHDPRSRAERARQLIDDRVAELAGSGADDLAWAKPYVDEARADIARRPPDAR